MNKGQLDGVEAKAKGYASTAKTEAIAAASQNTAAEIGKLDIDTKLATVDTNAKGYADTALTTAKSYTDNTALKANDQVQKKANTYTDDKAGQTLKSANENTERRAVVAENNAVTRSKAYTDESSGRTLESANTYTNHRAVQAENNAVARSNDYTNQRFRALKKQVDRNEKRANGGIAGAMAMSAIPSVPGHDFSFGMAASGYRDQGAIAVGVKANITPNTSVSLNTAWDSGNGVGVAAGVAVGW
ncbi:TPA: YadA-like family protein [Klebsiella pneumoniae]|nr:YadA-like family protein [Klebsiella pneumoniae]HCD6923204.1 YadA-like family protein [Klebsiella pneumoniae]HCD6996075.1 YadA-like family protein [Klebsiella pneumoniae]HCD7354057.1 YadA-like family protein [Klebsiella pneumoniae]HCD8379643.1 YadA-like family protein [Klebsiella pneumoniae]